MSTLTLLSCLVLALCVTNSEALFKVAEIPNSFAAEVLDFNAAELPDSEFDRLVKYLLTYKVLILKNQQNMTVETQRDFSSRFGHLHEHLESTSHLPGYRDVNVVSNIRNTTGVATGLFGEHVENFHTDLSWSHLPTKVTILRSDILPLEGGDTHYADSTSAYEDLSDSLKERINGLTGHYSYLKYRTIDDIVGVVGEDAAYIERGQDHPLIITHPITGKKNIYANAGHTASINGLSKEESDEILGALFSHVSNPKYLYIHKWSEGDVAIWDNRAMQHKATPAPSYPRRLIRTTASNDDIPRENIEDIPTFVAQSCAADLGISL